MVYVYLIKDPATGFTKIGSSRHPPNRLSALRAKFGRALDIIGAWKFMADAFRYERRLHARFKEQAVAGLSEWFRLAQTDISDVETFLDNAGGEFHLWLDLRGLKNI